MSLLQGSFSASESVVEGYGKKSADNAGAGSDEEPVTFVVESGHGTETSMFTHTQGDKERLYRANRGMEIVGARRVNGCLRVELREALCEVDLVHEKLGHGLSLINRIAEAEEALGAVTLTLERARGVAQTRLVEALEAEGAAFGAESTARKAHRHAKRELAKTEDRPAGDEHGRVASGLEERREAAAHAKQKLAEAKTALLSARAVRGRDGGADFSLRESRVTGEGG
jgi:hypothetical protein